jgi:hypothetical protein
MHNETKARDRRVKSRFPIHREFRYKVLEDGAMVASGSGETLDMSSGGVSVTVDQPLTIGAFIELSISWPVLLDARCPMRLITFGRVVRCAGGRAACTIDKYEFRTQARTLHIATPVRTDSMLQRWADSFHKQPVKTPAAATA